MAADKAAAELSGFTGVWGTLGFSDRGAFAILDSYSGVQLRMARSGVLRVPGVRALEEPTGGPDREIMDTDGYFSGSGNRVTAGMGYRAG